MSLCGIIIGYIRCTYAKRMSVHSRASRDVDHMSQIAVIVANDSIIPIVLEAEIIGVIDVVYEIVAEYTVPARRG